MSEPPVGVIAIAFGHQFLPIVEFRTNPRGATRQGKAEDKPPTGPKPQNGAPAWPGVCVSVLVGQSGTLSEERGAKQVHKHLHFSEWVAGSPRPVVEAN